MQAIILAAGMGRRLGELTRNNTKCMVEVNGVTLIDRMLNQLSRLSLNRVIIVVGYEGKKLIDYIGERYDSELRIEYVENQIYDKTNNIYSLALAKDKLQEDDTLLIESDLIFDDRLFDLILADSYPNLALVAKYQTWMDGTMVKLDDENNIVNFIPKQAFNYNDVESYFKTVNIYKFSKEFSTHKYVPFLEAYTKALGNNEYYEQVLRVITFLDKSDLKALPISDERWYEIDDIQDKDIAEALFAEGEERLKKYMKRYGGYWRFPGMLDYCYLVNPYYPSARMMNEMRANFNTLLTEYPSGMYVNSLIAGKCFGVKQEYIIPGNGAAELIKSLMSLLPGKLGVTYPTFEEYPNRRDRGSLEIYTPNNDDFRYSVDDLILYFSDHTVNAILLINPDNPSGNFVSKSEVLRLARWCQEKSIRLIVDESFVDFSTGYKDNSLLLNKVLESYPNLIVIKSISKSFGVPGLRLGILASSDLELVDRIKKDVAIWNLNSFAEFFMQIYSKYESDYHKACEKFQVERERFRKKLETIPYLRVIPSEANYFLCEVLSPYKSHRLTAQLLLNNNILVKDCSSKLSFAMKDYVRIAIRSKHDNDRLIHELSTCNIYHD